MGGGGLGGVAGPAIILKSGRLYIKIAQTMKGKHVVMKYGRKSKEHVKLGKNRPSKRRRPPPPPPPFLHQSTNILGSSWRQIFVIDWTISVNVGQIFVSASNFFSRTPVLKQFQRLENVEFCFPFEYINTSLVKFGNNMGSSSNKKVI